MKNMFKIFNQNNYQYPKSYYPNKDTFEYFEPLIYPLENNGLFVKGFPLNKAAEIFRKYGVVVIENVLTDDEINKTIDEIWEELKFYNTDIDRNNQSTWTNENWPSIHKFGFVGDGKRKALTLQAIKNRVNPNVVDVYKTIFETEQLWTNVSRFGFMRPTIATDGISDYSDRATTEFLHIDMNPITGRRTTFGFESTKYTTGDEGGSTLDPTCNAMSFPIIQGFIALSDAKEEDGGFHAIPGSHRYMQTWKAINRNICLNHSADCSTVWLNKSDPLYNSKYIQKFPIKKGSMLIWDNRLFHGNYPNKSTNTRLVQYIQATPIFDMGIRPWPIPSYLRHRFDTIDDVGKKMYGLLPYDSKFGKKRFNEERNNTESSLFEIHLDWAKY